MSLIRRGLTLFSFALLATFIGSGTAAADDFTPDDIVFPVIGDVYYSDTWGAPRSGGRTHEGTDLMSVGGVKGLPVVAADSGVVKWIGSSCCYLAIDHGGGWETWYIHLDNDTPGTDDGQRWGIADGVVVGAEVTRGQLIGWLGDSGNAEWTAPHLHFEIRHNGAAINPYPYVLDAEVLSSSLTATWNGQFRDDEGSVHERNIDLMYQHGITRGCNPPDNDRYCPADDVTRGQLAAFLVRNLELPGSDQNYFTDDDEGAFNNDINALMASGIGFGCSEEAFCPSEAITRSEMAEMLTRAYEYADPGAGNYFSDDDGHRFEASIDALFGSGITVGCDPDDRTRFCPDAGLTRAQMATFMARATELGG